MTILNEIVDYKRSVELPQRMEQVALQEMLSKAVDMPEALDFAAALQAKRGVALIAEVKRASPSRGLLCPDFDPLKLAISYAEAGASAISVLTDEKYFQGSLDFLAQIRRHVPQVPLLRKDFVVDSYQIYEARAAGADAVLLIAAVLADDELAELLGLTRLLGMTALIEVHNEAELGRVLPLSPRLVGVNNRNLHDFSVNIEVCLALRAMVPPEICFVAESGIHTAADVQRLAEAGVDAMLIGEALVTAEDIGQKVKELIDENQG